jgi:hypothetical protein
MSNGPLEVLRQNTQHQLPPADEGPAQRGTALLCASGPRDPAKAPDGLSFTMFSGALLDTLKEGNPHGDDSFTLYQLGESVRNRIFNEHRDEAVRPEILSPDQTKGDVAKVAIFPNPARRGPAIQELIQRLRSDLESVRQSQVTQVNELLTRQRVLESRIERLSNRYQPKQSAKEEKVAPTPSAPDDRRLNHPLFFLSQDQWNKIPKTVKNRIEDFALSRRIGWLWSGLTCLLCTYVWIVIALFALPLSSTIWVNLDVHNASFVLACIASLMAAFSMLASDFLQRRTVESILSTNVPSSPRKKSFRDKRDNEWRQYDCVRRAEAFNPRFIVPGLAVTPVVWHSTLSIHFFTAIIGLLVRFVPLSYFAK